MPLTRIDSAFLDLDAIGGIDFDVQSGVPTLSVDATTHRVGIGTDTPARKLQIHENSSSGSFLSFTNTTTGANAADGALIGIQDDESLIVSNKEDNHIEFHTNNTERLLIDNVGSAQFTGQDSPSGRNTRISRYGSLLVATTGEILSNARCSIDSGNGNIATEGSVVASGVNLQSSSTNSWFQTGASYGGTNYVWAAKDSSSNVWHSGLQTDGDLCLGGNITGTSNIKLYGSSGNATFIGKINVGASYSGGEIFALGKSSGTSYLAHYNGGTAHGFIGHADQLVSGGSATDFAIRATNNLVFATNGNNERLRITSSGELLLGATSTTNITRLGQTFAIASTDSFGGMSISGFTGTTNHEGPVIDLQRSRATSKSTGTVVVNNDRLGSLVFRGDDGTDFADAAYMLGEVDGTPNGGFVPGRFAFYTGTASATPVERLRVDSSGNIRIMTANGMLKWTASSGNDPFIRSIGSGQQDLEFNTGGNERIRIASDGQIGMGKAGQVTPNGNSPLTIQESDSNSETICLRATNSGGNGSQPGIVMKTAANGHIGGIYCDVNSDYMRLSTSGNDAIYISNTGNVGIGYATPSQKLVVKGTTSLMATNSTNQWMAYTYTDNTLRINYNGAGADEITVLSSGEVGIGAFTPSAGAGLLQIAGGLRIAGSASASDTVSPYIYRTSGYDHLNFATSGNERLRIDSSGNVNIGAKNYLSHHSTVDSLQVGYALNLYEDSYTSGTDNYVVLGNNVYYNNGNKYMRNDEASRIMMQAGTFYFQSAASGTAGNAITFSDVLRITSTGNVGIGDNAPSQKLNVAGNMMLEGNNQFMYLSNVGTGNAGIYVRGNSESASNSNHFLRSHSTGMFTWEVTGSEKMRINSGGQLNFGGDFTQTGFTANITRTSSETDILRIKGNSQNAFIRFQDNDSTSNYTLGADDGPGSNTNNFVIYDRNANAYRFVLDGSGNVGIGTQGPLLKLDVRGGIQSVGSSISSPAQWISAVGDQSAYDNMKVWYTGYNSGSPRLYISPGTVPGSGTVNTYVHLQNITSSGAGTNRIGLKVDNNIEAGTYFGIANVGGSIAGSGGSENWIGTKTYGGDWALITKTHSSTSSVIGNVGIGTTNPQSLLQVGSRTAASPAGMVDIVRGEVIGGGTGPRIRLIHGPDSGTQRTHSIYSYIGDLRIFADASESLELSGANVKFKDGNRTERFSQSAGIFTGIATGDYFLTRPQYSNSFSLSGYTTTAGTLFTVIPAATLNGGLYIIGVTYSVNGGPYHHKAAATAYLSSKNSASANSNFTTGGIQHSHVGGSYLMEFSETPGSVHVIAGIRVKFNYALSTSGTLHVNAYRIAH